LTQLAATIIELGFQPMTFHACLIDRATTPFCNAGLGRVEELDKFENKLTRVER